MSTKSNSQTKVLQLVVCGMMVALDVVVSRLASLNTGTERIGLALFVVAAVARLYGPIAAAAVHALADIIGAILFPAGGAYFPGFTIAAAIVGVVYGLCYHRPRHWAFIPLAVISTQVVCTILLNTWFLSILFGKGFLVFLPKRLIQAAIAAPVQIVFTPILFRLLDKRIAPLLGVKNEKRQKTAKNEDKKRNEEII